MLIIIIIIIIVVVVHYYYRIMIQSSPQGNQNVGGKSMLWGRDRIGLW